MCWQMGDEGGCSGPASHSQWITGSGSCTSFSSSPSSNALAAPAGAQPPLKATPEHRIKGALTQNVFCALDCRLDELLLGFTGRHRYAAWRGGRGGRPVATE